MKDRIGGHWQVIQDAATGRYSLYHDDFEYDMRLELSGDFPSESMAFELAVAIASKLA